MTDKEIPTRFSYQNEYWVTITGSNIVDVIEEEEGETNYSTNEKHLYKLEDGRYAVVQESGCSCYGLADAVIETYDTLVQARKAYNAIEL